LAGRSPLQRANDYKPRRPFVLDNPGPAAGMRSLTVQNLATGSVTNGGDPNAISPDVTVTVLNVQAYTGIGVGRTLRAQVSTLTPSAGFGAAGSIPALKPQTRLRRGRKMS